MIDSPRSWGSWASRTTLRRSKMARRGSLILSQRTRQLPFHDSENDPRRTMARMRQSRQSARRRRRRRQACARGLQRHRKRHAHWQLPPKAARSSVSTSVHEGLLKKAAKVARPPPSVKPTAHAGGKIYFSETKGCFRVYLRVGDRIEKCVAANPANKADIEHKFQICCALIENDKR